MAPNNTGNPSSAELGIISNAYLIPPFDQHGYIVAANLSTIPACTAGGGGAKLNASVMNVVPYTVYFCQAPNAAGMNAVAQSLLANGINPSSIIGTSGAPAKQKVGWLLGMVMLGLILPGVLL